MILEQPPAPFGLTHYAAEYAEGSENHQCFFHKERGVWRLKGVRETLQKLLAPASVLAQK